jgi:protease-4
MEKVLDIAQGRVWSGVRAVELGLVDSNGGLREAISLAASKADISDNFHVEEVLEDMDPMMMLMQQLNSGAISILLDKDSREAISFYKEIKGAMLREGVQAYCPYTLNIN